MVNNGITKRSYAKLKYQAHFCLVTGMAIGFTLAYIVLIPPTVRHTYSRIFGEEYLEVSGPVGEVGDHNRNDTFHRMMNTEIADNLYKEVKILCMVMTSPNNHESIAVHVKASWGKRCNILLFMSSKADKNLPAIGLSVREGRKFSWLKTKEALKYVYKNYYHEADWFIKADDDTYVIMENLRYMVSDISPQTPIYFGFRFSPFVKQVYMSQGKGYVLSKEALRRFVEEAIPNREICNPPESGVEYVEMEICLEAVNVEAGDSKDSNQKGLGCCFDNAVSFQHLTPNAMYVMEYLLYHLHPFGRIIKFSEVLQQRLMKRNESRV
ncbi:glycoprotein-N-acetylgalactosamine 3-beta-galactosyltransferase 1 [Leptinotarsa decemlineata]|uniref:glycoprotein-N-acetylgalactosamine 3-beta-galactosyltransferase 1 n=1 Tax=Leptinotarsa decemlineata TaxID=7539 RepID=UPI003D3053BD